MSPLPDKKSNNTSFGHCGSASFEHKLHEEECSTEEMSSERLVERAPMEETKTRTVQDQSTSLPELPGFLGQNEQDEPAIEGRFD